MLTLCYSALSPYCRKVRMVMDHMELDYVLFDSCDIHKYPIWNPRAEIPILQHDDIVVRNSATIVDYLVRAFPNAPSPFPSDLNAFAAAKDWELIADTMVDPIVTNLGIFKFGDLPEKPEGLLKFAQADIAVIYDKLDAVLAGKVFVAGDVSIADYALFPHLTAAQRLDIPFNMKKHKNVMAWLGRMMQSPIGQSDLKAVLAWWSDKDNQDVETDKINWGTYRLEWFLASGYHEWFVNEIKRDAVLWSVGPNNNAKNSPLHQT